MCIRDRDIPKPDPDAFAFACKDKDGSSLGVLYMDFYTRPGKGGGAWCGGYRDQSYKDGKKAVSYTHLDVYKRQD